jgi:type II secretory pathway pseudopilin PulG
MKTTRVQDVGSNVALVRERDGDAGRAGMTLMEVLMSCAIMTIGVVMVATVFPLSTLRVLEASKQTNSTITRFSAEALIDVDPNFVNNPDGVAGANSPGYRVSVYFVDPYGYQTFHADAGLPAPIGAGPIQTNVTSLLRDTWGWLPAGNATLPLGTRVNVPLPRRYAGASMFAFNPGTTPGVSIRAYPTNTQESDSAIARAVQLVGQPDNWKMVAEGLVDPVSTTTNITSLTLDNDVDLSSVPTTILTPYAPVPYRAVIFDRLGDQGGEHSEIRYLTASSSSPPTVTWVTPLSTRFENGNIGKVRIEQLDEVYTWALTVRRLPTGDSNIDVVVFFRRSFNPEHEFVYPAAFRQFSLEDGTSLGGTTGQPGADGYDDNENGTDDEAAEIGFPKRLQSVSGVALTVAQQSDDQPTPVVRVDFQSLPAGTDRPVFRKGGFVCDTKNGLWYRIQGMQNETDTTIELVLDKFIQQDGTEDRIQPVPLPYPYTPTFDAGEDTNGNGVFESGGIYWNPTVVNVFSVR